MLWQYANGRGDAFLQTQPAANKGYGAPCHVPRRPTAPPAECCRSARRSVCVSTDGQAGSCIIISSAPATLRREDGHGLPRPRRRRYRASSIRLPVPCSIRRGDRKNAPPAARRVGYAAGRQDARHYSLFDAADLPAQEKLATAVDRCAEKNSARARSSAPAIPQR